MTWHEFTMECARCEKETVLRKVYFTQEGKVAFVNYCQHCRKETRSLADLVVILSQCREMDKEEGEDEISIN